MTTTKAQALAVALDHAEETGEYPPELVDRVVAMFEGLRIVSMTKAGAGDNTTRGRGADGTQLVSVTEHREHRRTGAELMMYEAVVHTAATRTWRCERRWLASHDEAVAWLRERLRPRGWTLLVLR